MTLWSDVLQHHIDGEPFAGKGTDWLLLTNPATEALLARVPVGSEADVDLAMAAAVAAAPGWSTLGADGRAELVARAVERAVPHADELARLQCVEMGQPWAVARPLVDAVLGGLSAALTAARGYAWETRLGGDDVWGTDQRRVPRGVGVLITPWNFPLPVAMGGLAGLLAGGNTVVWKPSELSPLSASRLVELLELPAGVLNLVLGDAGTGQALASHPDNAITVFTGSVEAGRDVNRRCAERFVPTLLELGGKDPVVVDETVDPEVAAATVTYGALWNSGQVCTSMERVYLHRDIADEVLAGILALAAAKVVGDPLDPATDLGPLASRAQRDQVHAHVRDAVDKGATMLLGGVVPEGVGWFYPPTVVTGIRPGMLLHDVETFGPVVAVTVVDSFEEGLRRAADSAYALCATILTTDPTRAGRGREIPAALCWVNGWQGGAPGMVYEPARSSGLGAVGTLDTFTRPTTLHRARP
jgi:succinate-semialdehyde dehydrogenase/glutarate-semialdehyde dehydrogenase